MTIQFLNIIKNGKKIKKKNKIYFNKFNKKQSI